LRTFLALPLPESIKDWLTEIQPPPMQGVRIVGREEFHLTLHFLGEVAEAVIPDIVEALHQVNCPPLTLRLRRVGAPMRSPPHVLWIAVERNDPLQELQRQTGTALAGAIGFQPESRPYSPHVTLARVKPSASLNAITGYLSSAHNRRSESFTVDSYSLFASDLSGSVPRYQEIHRFPLQNQQADPDGDGRALASGG
jgi:RNA 2',3'-cyclic 3'-phosphodiesterase